jgi:hypothetical protein
LREFDGWSGNVKYLKKDKVDVDGFEKEVERELEENDILYIQENYTVTDGIFLDEGVVYNNTTPEWISFCQGKLNFQIPTHEPAQAANSDNGAASGEDSDSPPKDDGGNGKG